MLSLLLFAFWFLLVSGSKDSELSLTSKLAAMEKIRIGEETFTSLRRLHYVWYVHSVKALLVQLSKKILPTLSQDARREFELCLKSIEEKTDVVRSSRCLVQARRNAKLLGRAAMEKKEKKREPSSLRRKGKHGMENDITKKKKRMERERSSRALLLRHFMFWNRQKLQEDERKKRVKRSEYRLVRKFEKESPFRIRTMSESPPLLTPSSSPIQTISRSILSLFRPEQAQSREPWTRTYRKLLQFKKAMDGRDTVRAHAMYDLPMDELVLGSEDLPRAKAEPSRSAFPAFLTGSSPLVKSAFDLASAIHSHSSKAGKESNVKLLSPRFAPLMPETNGEGIFSPSLLAFYKDEAEEQIAPLPQLIDQTGINKKDAESVMEVIMEVSGARATVEEAFKTLRELNILGLDGDVVDATKRVESVFGELEKSLSRRQKRHLKEHLFAFLHPHQMKELYDKHGMKPEHDADFELSSYGSLHPSEREEALWLRVHSIANNETDHRLRRQVSVLAPTVLSPYMFSPVTGLAILGPVILSPSLFSPLLLNPAVLSPYVFSPAVGMPFILSPYLLSPYVMSPMVMAPFILNPYVLSPNVLNPYVLSPLILSPLVLCPDVLSPMVLGGAILSPSVASPNILSKSTLMASVLSPSFLS